MFINISIFYMHFVKSIFSTYCIARVWYDLCQKKRKKKTKNRRKKKHKKREKKSGGTRSAVGECEEAEKKRDDSAPAR